MNKVKRYMIFFVGLFINSLGVSVITKAELGTSPISSIPYVLSLNFPFSLGTFTVVFSVFLIFLQLLILRKNFKLEHALQIPISFLFGYFIDLTMAMLGQIEPQLYPIKCLMLLAGCVILGIGVYMEVLADVAMLPGESFVRAVCSVWNTEFGVTKICFDVSMTVIAGLLSIYFTHQLQGVREGTIVAALLVGFVARLIGKRLRCLEALVAEPTDTNGKDRPISENRWVIAIGRQYGSGGREIGDYLANQLGYDFYDREMIRDIARITGYSEDYVSRREESMTNSLLYDLVNQMYGYSSEKESPKDAIFDAQSRVIQECASKGNCVIVGRCSDYILKNDDHCLTLFLHAPLEERVKRIMEKRKLDEKSARSEIEKTDRRRADNYRHYTRKIWGHADHYDLCIDTRMGKEYILEAVKSALKQKAAFCEGETNGKTVISA